MKIFAGIAVAFVFMLRSALAMDDGVSLILGAGKLDCFYRNTNEGTNMDFDLQVLLGNDVGYHIRGPTGRIYAKEAYIKSSSKQLKLEETGTYEFCFDNSYSVVSHKVVYFDLGISDSRQEYDNLRKDEPTQEGTPEVLLTLESLQHRLDTISLFQSVIKAKGHRHHRIMKDQETKVMVFSVICCVLMMTVGVLQVYLVRKLFAEKRSSRRT